MYSHKGLFITTRLSWPYRKLNTLRNDAAHKSRMLEAADGGENTEPLPVTLLDGVIVRPTSRQQGGGATSHIIIFYSEEIKFTPMLLCINKISIFWYSNTASQVEFYGNLMTAQSHTACIQGHKASYNSNQPVRTLQTLK